MGVRRQPLRGRGERTPAHNIVVASLRSGVATSMKMGGYLLRIGTKGVYALTRHRAAPSANRRGSTEPPRRKSLPCCPSRGDRCRIGRTRLREPGDARGAGTAVRVRQRAVDRSHTRYLLNPTRRRRPGDPLGFSVSACQIRHVLPDLEHLDVRGRPLQVEISMKPLVSRF